MCMLGLLGQKHQGMLVLQAQGLASHGVNLPQAGNFQNIFQCLGESASQPPAGTGR